MKMYPLKISVGKDVGEIVIEQDFGGYEDASQIIITREQAQLLARWLREAGNQLGRTAMSGDEYEQN